MATEDKEHPLEQLVNKALKSADGDEIYLKELIEAFGNRGFGPLITLFALVAAIPPIGGIPGVPTTMGILIFLIAVQMAFGKQKPWLPGWLEERKIAREKAEKARDKASGLLEKIDALVGPRLQWAINDTGQRVAAIACCLLALLMPPLELLPFAVMIPAVAIILFGLAITARDGLLMILASLVFLTTLIFAAMQLPGLLAG